VDFFDADGLAGKDGAEINFFVPPTDPAAVGDDNDLVVEGSSIPGSPLVQASRRLIDLGRTLPVPMKSSNCACCWRMCRSLIQPSGGLDLRDLPLLGLV
jgi:hypothetical protein